MAKAKKTTDTKSRKNNSTANSSDKKEQIMLRTPIVAVVGHVDHGKTSLLDAIKDTDVQGGEAGGITQNTRAHNVKLDDSLAKPDQGLTSITFLDTPGHEAFSNMRSRGARVADFAVLVVAADDGVQPQTKESIEFIKKNNLPVIIACNKMDLPGANPDKVKQELSSHGILVEEYGGEALFVEVSAIKGEGIDQILENIVLVAEINELKSQKPASGVAEGFVLESNLDSDLGAVALTLIKSGELKPGDFIYADGEIHKVRATLDEFQQKNSKAIQGEPTWLIGVNNVLQVGENIIGFDDKQEAEDLKKRQDEKNREEEGGEVAGEVSDVEFLAQLIAQKEENKASETNLKVILKADTRGTLEAVRGKIDDLSYEDARVSVFSEETGDISEKDVEMARDIEGIVIGFQVGIDKKAQTLSRNERILVRTYEIIYDLIDEIDAVIQSMLQPEEEIEEVAVSEVKQVFTLTNGKQVAGSVVTKGTVTRGYSVFVERDGEEIGEGKITSLKQNKEDVKEIKKGMECGIMIEPQIDLQQGDRIVCFKVVK